MHTDTGMHTHHVSEAKNRPREVWESQGPQVSEGREDVFHGFRIFTEAYWDEVRTEVNPTLLVLAHEEPGPGDTDPNDDQEHRSAKCQRRPWPCRSPGQPVCTIVNSSGKRKGPSQRH